MIVAGFKLLESFSEHDYSYFAAGFVETIEKMLNVGHVFSSMVVKR